MELTVQQMANDVMAKTLNLNRMKGTRADKAAEQATKEQGLNITIVQGGSIKTGETVDGEKRLVKSRALVEGDTMIVRSDDPTMSAEQLARHEATHKRIERGEVQLGSTVRQLLKKYSPAQIREIIHLYAEAYGNVNMNAAQVLEEIVCDAMAEMNAFATEQTERLAGEVGRFLRDVKKAAQGGTLEGGQKKNAPGGVKYSIQNITGESGRDYGVGVYLDSQLLSGLTDSERIKMVKEFVKELGGQSLTAYEPDGSEVAIKIAEPNQKFRNKSGKSVPVIDDLTTKYNKNKTKQEAIVLIDELVATSRYQGSEPSKHTHGWLDNNGKNSWELWTTYIQDRENAIWKASLNVTTATDGKKYLYDISKIKKVEQPGESRAHLPPVATVAQQEQNVKQKYSRELETIEELKQQNELLKKQVDYWHSQTAVTVGERGADKEEVRKLARQLKRDYGSQTEVEDYLQALQWLADNRQNKKAKFADMMQTAENVAREVLDGCRVNVNEEQMETMKELKKFLRGRYINVDESLKKDIGDFGDFKKLNRALHFREDGSGTGVDSLWLELQDQFGEGLFPEDVQNPADQIRHIADTVDSMEAQWVNPYDADMELTVQQMANDVMAKTLNLNRMKGTRADKAAQQATKEQGLNITIVQGGSIKTGETVDGEKRLVKSRALVEGDTMIVRSDDPTMSAEQLARHEATHKRIERGEVQLGSTVRQLLKKYSPAQIREIIHLYAEAYGNVNMNAAQVLEEIVCDAMAEMNAFATEQTERLAGEVGRFLRDVKKAAQGGTLEGGQKKNAPGGVKRSMEFTSLRGKTQQEITTRYRAEVDDVLSKPYENPRQLVVGYTPAVYEKLGMPSLPLTIGSGHVYSIAKTEQEARQDGNFKRNTHYHGLGDTAVKNIYDAIQDPVMVIAAKDADKNATPLRSTHSVVAIADIGTAGKSLLAPIEITAERKVNGTRMDVNTISSVYEKSVKNLVTEAIAQENSGDIGVYYAKKEALTLPGAGVQFPTQLQQSIASNSIVHRFAEKVNMKISETVQSQQFKRWFGDWQNDPAHASKVVNADGTPKVVYHGTNAEFTAFNSSSSATDV